MTISSETRKTSPFVGNNVTTAFPFTFKVFSSSEVEVVRVVDATEVETTLVLTTDYTVSLNADQDADPGGTVTLLSALATGTTLVITSNVANTQSTALTNNGGFYPHVIEDALDRATIQIQQLSEQVERSVKVPITSTTDPDALVASVVASEASAAASAAAAASSAAAAAAAVPSGSLGYTPVNITGDTMTGLLEVPSLKVNGSAAITTIGDAATKTTGSASGNVPLVGTESATEALAGLSRRNTQAEAEAGTLDEGHMTPLKTAQAIATHRLVTMSSVATTSGTAITFTGIPSGVSCVEVVFSGVSVSGSAVMQVRLGTSSGVENTGYSGATLGCLNGALPAVSAHSSGFGITADGSPPYTVHGVLRLINITGNYWVASGSFGDSGTLRAAFVGGTKLLAGVLDRISITTNGADTFDNGSATVQYA